MQFKFYLEGILKSLPLKDVLRRNNDFDVIDINNNVYVPKTPVTATPVAGALTIKDTGSVRELYYGSTLICRFDEATGNLIYGLGDINVVPIEAGGTGEETIEDMLVSFGLDGVADRVVGTAVGNLIEVLTGGKLPALSGENLTNLPTIPVGEVKWFAMEDPETGYLEADGSLILRASYPALFAKIGTVFGAGDGSTTFRIPDVRGVFIRGWDNGRALDSGRAFGSYQEDAMQPITGGFGLGAYSPTGAFKNLGTGGYTLTGYAAGSQMAIDSSLVTRTATETRPKNIALLPCIKY